MNSSQKIGELKKNIMEVSGSRSSDKFSMGITRKIVIFEILQMVFLKVTYIRCTVAINEFATDELMRNKTGI